MSKTLEEKVEEIKDLVGKYCKENSIELTTGKLTNSNRMSLTFVEQVDTGDEDISSKDYNKFMVADKKHNLEDQGIELKMIINSFGSLKPRSKVKVKAKYKVVSAVASAKEKIIEVQRMDGETAGTRTKWSIEDTLYYIENPIDDDDIKIMNGTHKYDSDGNLEEIPEDERGKKKKK